MLRAIAADAVLLRFRTAVWIICLVCFIAIGVLTTQSIREMAPPTASQLTAADETYRAKVSEWEAEHEQWEQACIDDGGTPAQCAVPAPTPEAFQPWQASYADAARVAILISAALLAMSMFVVGAIYVGGEFASGAMSAWLSHIPNRNVVLISKLVTVGYLAVCGGIFVFGVLLIALNIAARGWAVPVESADLGASLVSAGRGTLLTFLSALIGAGAAFVTRRAGMAIGLAAAYVVLNRLTFSFNIGVGAVPVLDLVSQGQAWVSGGMSLAYWEGGMFREMDLDPSLGGVAWGGLTILVLIAAFGMQHLREHT